MAYNCYTYVVEYYALNLEQAVRIHTATQYYYARNFYKKYFFEKI